jgi:hypothetical protein
MGLPSAPRKETAAFIPANPAGCCLSSGNAKALGNSLLSLLLPLTAVLTGAAVLSVKSIIIPML